MPHAEIKLNGINASPGICVGKAYLVDREGVDVVEKYYIGDDSLPHEKNRFKGAVKKAADELYKIIQDSPKDMQRHSAIIETHIALLQDKMLYQKTLETIEKERVNAEWALKKIVSDIKTVFKNMSNPYLKERSADIGHVSDLILKGLTGSASVNISDIDKRVILVAHDLSPAETSKIQLERVKGFITNLGGMASHTGIIARTLEIPAVLGLEKATEVIHNDDMLILDGNKGVVIIHPAKDTLALYGRYKDQYEEHKAVITRRSQSKAETKDHTALSIMGNIELPEEVVSVKDHGADGIGLYRTEFQYMGRPDFPDEEELLEKYKDVIEIMSPKPVIIRTLDINGDKAVTNHIERREANPALGLRAIRYCLKRPDVFKTQLRAILRSAVYGHVKILFPMISCLEELLETKACLDQAAASLKQDGLGYNRNIDIGIMIEVPSAVIVAETLADHVDFFSIGTNDLIQYAFAIDRNNRQVAHLYQPLNPAVIRLIKQTVDVAEKKKIKVAMCGEMAADPLNIPVLIGLGIHELSMNPQSIPFVKEVIRQITVKDSTGIIKEILKQTTTRDVSRLIQSHFGPILRGIHPLN